MFYVYILQSEKNGQLYIGQTNNLADRLYRHNAGQVIATKNRGPWKMIYVEQYQSRSQAMYREEYLKSLKSRKAIESLIQKPSTSGVEQPGSSPGP